MLVVMEFDVFISHASEDKNNFVRLPAEKLQEHQVKVYVRRTMPIMNR